MSATGRISGTLSFQWKVQSVDAQLEIYRRAPGSNVRTSVTNLSCLVSDTWQNCQIKFPLQEDDDFLIMDFMLTSEMDRVSGWVNQMTWTPGGGEPQQGDPVVPMAAGVEGAVFSLTIPTTGGVSYGVWTNADLSVPAAEWGFWKQETATDATTDFSFEMLPGVPQLFFRAFKLK